jgi:CheY-like chemotaxis protein
LLSFSDVTRNPKTVPRRRGSLEGVKSVHTLSLKALGSDPPVGMLATRRLRRLRRTKGRKPPRAGAVDRPVTVLLACVSESERQQYLAALQAESGVKLVGEVTSPGDAIALLRGRPNIFLLDSAFLLEHGNVLLTMFRRTSSRTRIILLTDDIPPPMVLEAMCLGAVGYLEKSHASDSLLKAVRSVHAGEAWIPRRLVGDLVECLIRLSPPPRRRPGGKT